MLINHILHKVNLLKRLNMDINYIPERRTDIISQDIDGESLILDSNGGVIHQLNSTASIIWQSCDGSKSISDIAIILTENYSIAEDIALKDVFEALNSFQVINLLNG